ncbi:hypothetical protein M569_05212 [Genlisea aurea]|uniref:Uncharacterized protein n=1 Tax=Genlisea aurea TaxID=192259 RepID=S8CRX3_9LAMI|nr:hypothetical protein M569_05212 [Genlisea aurea]
MYFVFSYKLTVFSNESSKEKIVVLEIMFLCDFFQKNILEALIPVAKQAQGQQHQQNLRRSRIIGGDKCTGTAIKILIILVPPKPKIVIIFLRLETSTGGLFNLQKNIRENEKKHAPQPRAGLYLDENQTPVISRQPCVG